MTYDVPSLPNGSLSIINPVSSSLGTTCMITAPQLKAARALLQIDQRRLAEAAGVSVPTIQRMEGSAGQVRGNVESLVKVVEALERLGIELIGEGAASLAGGRGVRLKPAQDPSGPG
jgi:transcriptional regulator with XRE-family HTH domain